MANIMDTNPFTARDFGAYIVGLGDDLKDSDAVFAFGIVAAVQALLPFILFVTLSQLLPVYMPGELMTYFAQAIWWPVFLAWIGISIFDNDLMRELYYISVLITLTGPFFLYWVGLADMLV